MKPQPTKLKRSLANAIPPIQSITNYSYVSPKPRADDLLALNEIRESDQINVFDIDSEALEEPVSSGSDLNVILSKSRLRLRVDHFYGKLFSGLVKSPAESKHELDSFIREIQTFKDSQDEFNFLKEEFLDKLRSNCRSSYAYFISSSLAPFTSFIGQIQTRREIEDADAFQQFMKGLLSEQFAYVQQFQTAVFQMFQQLNFIYSSCIAVARQLAHLEGKPAFSSLERDTQHVFTHAIFKEVKAQELPLADAVSVMILLGYSYYERDLIEIFTTYFGMTNSDESLDLIFQPTFHSTNIEISQADLKPGLQSLIMQYQALSLILVNLGWHDRVLDLERVVKHQVKTKVDAASESYKWESLAAKTESSQLKACIEKWMSQIVLKFFDMVFGYKEQLAPECAGSGLGNLLMMTGPSEEEYIAQVKKINEATSGIKSGLSCQSHAQISAQYIDLKIKEMFQFIYWVNHESAQPLEEMACIKELKSFLNEHEVMMNRLGGQMKKEVEERLLLPWVSTNFIIKFYITIIRVFKLIEPSSVLLEIISIPIRDYLKKRKDTLRCIVEMIIFDSVLYEQFGNRQVKARLTSEDGYISTDDDEEAAKDWQPVQMVAIKGAANKAIEDGIVDFSKFISAKRTQSDIVSTLVNTYGSQEEFIGVYRKLLEQRLLTSHFVYHNEVKSVELMKQRFGDSHLDKCEGMLRDIRDSERINKEVQKLVPQAEKKELGAQKIQVKVISASNWKKFDGQAGLISRYGASDVDVGSEEQRKKAKFVQGFLPSSSLVESLIEFEESYKKYKSLRTLVFRQGLGLVKLTLTFKNGSFPFAVTPLQATIIQQFGTDEEDEIVTLSDEVLKQKLSCPENSSDFSVTIEEVRKNCNFWVQKGVLKRTSVGAAVNYSSILVLNAASNSSLADDNQIQEEDREMKVQGHQHLWEEEGDNERDETEDMDSCIVVKDRRAPLQLKHRQSGLGSQLANSGKKESSGGNSGDQIRQYITMILNLSQKQMGGKEGKPADKIFSLLNSAWMPGQGLTLDKVKGVLEAMVYENKIKFNDNKYHV